jgi:pimeloyl-ACP methyl ester carboxylesterase
MSSQQFRDLFCKSADGLKLHGRAIGPESSVALPVLCLPGLTRTTEDFDDIARALATDPKTPRRVVAIDYRGRGLSGYDPDPAKYTVPVEMGDVLAVAAAAGIDRAILLGTSRGGIISMALAAARKDLLAGIILNDIGPALEIGGLMKIKGYITDPPQRKTWDEAARGLKDLFGPVFPSLNEAQWMAWARRAFREDGDNLVRTYDPRLADGFAAITPETPMPPIWDLFDKLGGVPLMLIHGALSDLLSPQSVRDMQARRPDMEVVEVTDEGHAPLLSDAPTIKRIVDFCARCD